ncbi:hypothetical protein HKBW3S43_01798, partial [Candidatus Hakubella thermalkaliphila]
MQASASPHLNSGDGQPGTGQSDCAAAPVGHPHLPSHSGPLQEVTELNSQIFPLELRHKK